MKQSLRELKANKIGVAILAFGAVALIFMLYLGYQKLFGGGAQYRPSQIEISAEETQSFVRGNQQRQTARNTRNIPKKILKSQKAIDEPEILGNWDTRLEKGRALIQLQKGSYRLILVMDNPNESRLYSNGTYDLRDNILTLKPNMAWGPPPSETVSYRVLTRAKMPVEVFTHKGRVLWQRPSADAGIYVPNYHPLLSRAQQDEIVVWDVLD